MMDPLSALSIAASVVQFVDFGGRLLSASYEIYKSPSGESAKEVNFSTISKDLTGLVAQIKDKVGISPSGNRDHTAPEYQLVKISEECEEIVTEFKGALDSLALGGTLRKGEDATQRTRLRMARGAIRKALGSIWNSSKIEGMIGQLEKMKDRLMTATLFCLWDESKRSEHRDIQFSEQLDDMIAMLRQLDERMEKMGQEPMQTAENGISSESSFMKSGKSIQKVVIDALNDGRSPSGVRIRQELVDYLWSQQRSPVQRNWIEGDSEGRNDKSAKLQDSFRAAIVDSLVFETIGGREEAIPKAFEKTFSWIFLHEPEELDGKQLRSSFPAWLESSADQLYWITGKPGSGKSTLMKFILQQPSLKSHLQKWAGNFDLLITSYYAWVAGSDLQKSCEGLMRTLLYQTLKLNPSLVSEVAPRRWSLLVTLRSIAKMPPWQRWEIEESFEILLANCGRAMRLALFIDGLDEFDSSPLLVLELIQNINSRTGIKVCVASRQWTEFYDAFHQNPMLRMQDLTAADMAHFVEVKLKGNRGFLELRRIFPVEAAHLIGDVVIKANGVFLWVSLVIRSLLEALTEGDGLSELQTAVDQLPSDIAQLYDVIWSRISSRKIAASSKLLVTFKAALGQLSYITLWLADEKQSLDFDINSLFADARAGIADIMRRRLDSKTRGILEISPDGTVNFLHRTARDWTLQFSVWEGIRSAVPEGFDPYLLLLKAETLRLADKSNRLIESLNDLWYAFNRFLWYASKVVDSSANTPELVRVLTRLNSEAGRVADQFLHIKFPNNNLLTDSYHFQRQEVQIHLHWSSTQCSGPAGRRNTFLGLMAQFCVLPYLRTQLTLEQNGTKLKTTKDSVSLLENAVFGYPGSKSFRTTHRYPISLSQRLETVAFLLERGASPKQIMTTGKAIIDEVRAMVASTSETIDPFMKESEQYWVKVEHLMDMKIRSKRTLKSVFQRTKKP